MRRSIEQIARDDDSLPTPDELDKPFVGTLAESPAPDKGELTESDLSRLRAENRNLKKLHEVIHFLGGADDLATVVSEIVGLGSSISGLSRGLLALAGSKTHEGGRAFKVKVVRGISRDERRTPEVRVLRKILAKTLEDRKSIFEGDARKSGFVWGVQDVEHYALGCVASLPLEADGELWGALLLDEPQRRRDFTPLEIELLGNFARHAALTLARLSDQKRLERRSERLRNEREVLRTHLEETQHELKALRVQSGRLGAQSSRIMAVPRDGFPKGELLEKSWKTAKRMFLKEYLTRTIEEAKGDLERAAAHAGVSVAKLVKLLQIYEVRSTRSAISSVSGVDRPH